ncbi:unnamed protein product [Orchesella dallaii]|uniref:Secreted protein n=1 Tax=Orchesella dallaii TaxID=48710 RepID=A0ABP1Q0S5_9HEXA
MLGYFRTLIICIFCMVNSFGELSSVYLWESLSPRETLCCQNFQSKYLCDFCQTQNDGGENAFTKFSLLWCAIARLSVSIPIFSLVFSSSEPSFCLFCPDSAPLTLSQCCFTISSILGKLFRDDGKKQKEKESKLRDSTFYY